MNTSTQETGKFALKYGLLLGAISIVFGLLLYTQELHYQQDWKIGIINMVVLITIIVLGMIQFKKSNDGFMSFVQALKIGVGISLIGGILVIIYGQVLQQFIDPDMLAKATQYSKQLMIKQGKDAKEIKLALEMGKKFQAPWIQIAIGLIGSLFLGFIVSLIAGLIIKKEQPV
ncbi:MAG: DUF4199 domain-containing protein [Bacteroidota bacterium]